MLRGIRVWVVVLTSVTILAGLLGFQKLYDTYSVQAPLQKALEGVPGVAAAEVTGRSQERRVELRLQAEADLQEVYVEALALAAADGINLVEVQDSATPFLKEQWRQAQFAVYQALQQGDYVGMAGAIEGQAQAAGFAAVVSMDEQAIYLKFQQGGDVLYRVVKRQQQQLATRGESQWQ